MFLTLPNVAETVIESTCNRLLLDDWRQFNELDPELEARFFPAWVVLKKPALAKNVFTTDCADADNASLQLICGLVGNKENGVNENIIKLRARLKPAARPGRQAFYGEKVYLKECFDHLHLFQTVSCQLYSARSTFRFFKITGNS